MFEAICGAITTTDLAGAIGRIVATLGGVPRFLADRRLHSLLQTAFAQLSDGILRGVRSPAGDHDRVDAQILTSALVGGLAAISLRWIAETGADDTAEARQVWDGYVTTLIATPRDGFAATAAPAR